MRNLFAQYSHVIKKKSTHDPKVHRTQCCFLRLELDLFVKYKKFFDCVTLSNDIPRTFSERDKALADELREEYPLAMFNESLMEYFDAPMAFSEGKVNDATIYTKSKYSDIEAWHSVLKTKYSK